MGNFETYKTDINLLEFILSHGYQLANKRLQSELSTSKTVKVKNEHETLLVFRNENNHQLYWNAHDNRDKGSIIDFCYSRLRLNPKSIHSYIKSYEPQINVPIQQPKPENQLFQIVPEYQHAYLQHTRKLDKSIYMSSIFQGLIGTYSIGKFTNTAFLLRNKNLQPVGVELKSKGFSQSATGSNKSDSLWITHNLNANKLLALTENPIDALSHYQLYGKRKYGTAITYASSCGYLTEGQIDFIKELTLNNNYSEILLLNDNDVDGISYNIRVLVALDLHPSSPQHQLIKQGKKSPIQIKIHIPSLDTDTFIHLKNALQHYYIQYEESADWLLYEIPKTVDHMRLNQTALLEGLRKNFIHVELPNRKDFNEDLQASVASQEMTLP